MKRSLLCVVLVSVLVFAGCEESAPGMAGMDAMGTDGGGIDGGPDLDSALPPTETVDECIDMTAPSMELGRVFTGSTGDATHQPRAACDGQGPDVSMRWAAPSTGTFTFDTRGSTFDTVLDIRAACTGASLACNDDLGPSMMSSEARLRLSEGDAVMIFVDGYGPNDSGDFLVNIREESDFDAGVDAGLDAGTDAGGHAGIDAGLDAGIDGGRDSGVDAGVDAAVVCRADQRECEGKCSTCPTTGVLATECSANRCVATECESGRRVRDGFCDAFTCSSGERACGSSCAACPTSGVATTMCSGNACVAATCRTDWVLRGGICEPGTCEPTERFCGDACTTCPSVGVASTTCSGSSCAAATCMSGYRLNGSACAAFTCPVNQRACGSECATCPTTGVASTTCDARGSCVAASCVADYEVVTGACQPIDCGAGQRSCGGVCRACPTDGVASTMCSGPACIAASCGDGYGLSGGACTPRTCATGSLFCSSACSTCPTVGSATFGCVGSTCEARTCMPDYAPVSYGGRTRCVDASWTRELVTERADTLSSVPHSAAIALTPSGEPWIAYYASGNVVVARRGAAGWTRTTSTLGTSGLSVVTNLAVDHAGYAHVVYYTWESSDEYVWRYARISSAGEASVTTTLGRESAIDTDEGIALAVDSAGDAHVAFNRYVGTTIGNRLYYRRTYLGAWQAEITIGSANVPFAAIAVDAADDVHIAGYAGGRVYYTKSTAGIFSEPIASTGIVMVTPAADRQLYIQGSTIEYWLRSGRNFHRSGISGGSPSALSSWGSFANSASYVSGGRGQNGFAMLEQPTTDRLVTYRAGSATAPSLAEETNLPIQRVLPGLIYDEAGHVHALGRQPRTTTSGMQLYYLRRE